MTIEILPTRGHCDTGDSTVRTVRTTLLPQAEVSIDSVLGQHREG